MGDKNRFSYRLSVKNDEGPAPAPQRGYHEATTRLLLSYYTRAATRLLRGYDEATTRSTTGLLRGYHEATTRLLRGYYVATTRLLTTRLLPGHYQATTRLLRGYYQEPHARHSASSTAAAAPLVCRSILSIDALACYFQTNCPPHPFALAGLEVQHGDGRRWC